MCGIYGLIGNPKVFDKSELKSTIRVMAALSEKRGKEASGIALLSGNTVSYYKQPIRATKMLLKDEVELFFKNIPDTQDNSFAAIGHARLVTNGSQAEYENNQPVITSHCIGIHNGIIINTEHILSVHTDIKPTSQLDTEVLMLLVDKYLKLDNSLESALGKAYKEISGSASIAVMTDNGMLGLATNTGSLYYASNFTAGLFVFASEGYFIKQLLESPVFKKMPGEFESKKLEPENGIIINIEKFGISNFDLNHSNQIFSKNTSMYSFKSLNHVNVELKRCTRCILPESFPQISFDEEGVCNHCRSHKSYKAKGADELSKIFDGYRSKDGSPDCILAFSGGRDSSYGLHYLKNEMNMHPITFTYDWGMVTDLARRNIANMCGKLGVENIIRSPDIFVKRKNIKKNIEAWLHRPELGIIPLFMAGDKYFYEIARQLKKETGIPLVIFCAGNNFERTEFKTAFCGVKESEHNNRLWAYSVKNKVDLLLYYGKQYLLNPRYLNSSLWDTFLAYYSTYIAKDDFIYLYHYIPWDESKINDTLINGYNWETADDTKNTWRIGDGTASFYNYIYYNVAGFSEHDTFRSNQIREGVISREEALRLVEEDNKPRYEAMAGYASLIGINLDEALTIINNIPKLY